MLDPAYLHDLFAAFGPVSVRAMFGGQGVYAEGRMFALVADGIVYIKVDSDSRPAFEAAGSHPFVYHGKGAPTVMQYFTIPDSDLDDPEAVAKWARLGAAAALRAAASKAPKRRKSV